MVYAEAQCQLTAAYPLHCIAAKERHRSSLMLPPHGVAHARGGIDSTCGRGSKAADCARLPAPQLGPRGASHRPGGDLGRSAANGCYIRNTPNRGGGIGALRLADSARANTRRVSPGVMMPSSHNRAVA